MYSCKYTGCGRSVEVKGTFCGNDCMVAADAAIHNSIEFKESQAKPQQQTPSPSNNKTNSNNTMDNNDPNLVLIKYLKESLAEKQALYDSCKVQLQRELDLNRDLRVKVDTLQDKHKYELEHEKNKATLALEKSNSEKEGLGGIAETAKGFLDKLLPAGGITPEHILAIKGIAGGGNNKPANSVEDIGAGLEGMSDELHGQLTNFARLLTTDVPNPEVVINGAYQLAMLDKLDGEKLNKTVVHLQQQVIELHKSKQNPNPDQ